MGKNLHSFLPIRYPRSALHTSNLLNLCNNIYMFHLSFSVLISSNIRNKNEKVNRESVVI